MKETCLILGGAGFIGSHLADLLLENNYNVVIFDKINCFKGNIKHILKRVKFVEGDFDNDVDIKNALKNVDYVYHFISTTLPQSSNLNPYYDAESMEKCLNLFYYLQGINYSVYQTFKFIQLKTKPTCSTRCNFCLMGFRY